MMTKKVFSIKMSSAIAVLLILLSAFTAKAQTIKGIEFETDPTYYFNKGYSFDVAIATQRVLFRALPYQTDVPSVFQGSDNKNYKQTIRGVSFDVDYFFKNHTKGFFIGPIFSTSVDEITNEMNNQSLKTNHITAGLRFGYRWFPFHKNAETRENGLFLSPFIAPLFNIANDVKFSDGRTFKYTSFFPFGGVHIGWKFNFTKSKNL
jgi:hypothetical protein